ncbi:MAG: hypothetical protein LBT27_04465 [Prevotellaceae bacterium]|jgi:hypothetical protein|nr:hypothetical protein [Prevotellaceae bacterium]
MATIISKPEGLCLSGNLPKVIIESEDDVRVQVLAGTKQLIDETYTPDFDNRVALDISDIIINELIFTVPNLNIITQTNLLKTFALHINNSVYNFSALRTGVRDLSLAPVAFLTKNFLTWQERQKIITDTQPEYLTYFATKNCYAFITAYFADGTNQTVKITNLQANICVTINVNYFINNFSEKPQQAEIFITAADDPDSEIISKYQYYKIVQKLPDEQYFLFENSLGGIDTLRCTGDVKHTPEFTSETALMSDTERTFFIDKKDIRTQNTGNITYENAAWMQDFFAAKNRYLFAEAKLQPIIIDEVTAETSIKNRIKSFEFSYRPAVASMYLNLDTNIYIDTGNDAIYLIDNNNKYIIDINNNYLVA